MNAKPSLNSEREEIRTLKGYHFFVKKLGSAMKWPMFVVSLWR